MLRQAVYEEGLATAMQLQSKAQKEEEELTINEHKQLKQSEETLTTNEVITMMLQATHEETLAPAEENLNTKPEEKSTTTAQKQPEEIRKEKIASALMNTKEPQPKVHQQEPSTRGGPQKKTQKEESLITKKFVSHATVARDKFVAKIQREANTKLEQQNSEENTINEHKQLKQSEETLT